MLFAPYHMVYLLSFNASSPGAITVYYLNNHSKVEPRIRSAEMRVQLSCGDFY